MGILDTFKALADWVLLVPKLVKLNADQRQEVRDVVGGISDELTRGLDLVAQRIEGARRIALSKEKGAKKELVIYLDENVGKLFEAFSEFKICRGLREKRDHFKQVFHPAKAAVRRENIDKVTQLLYELESDERMIIDEVGPLLNGLRTSASKSKKKFLIDSDEALKTLELRKRRLKKIARSVHDSL